MASQRVENFIGLLAPTAIEIGERYGLDPRLIISQAALETGWGDSVAGNNYFGVKSHGQPGGVSVKTHEYINGRYVPVNGSFRAYDGVVQSMEDYANFLATNERYTPVFDTQGLENQIEAVADAGYATDPRYASKLKSVAKMIDIEPYLGGRPGGTALSAANELAGAPPERPASMSAYTGWEQTPPPLPRADPRGPYQPPLPRSDPRRASQQMNDIAGMAPPSVLPRLNDADINERVIDTYGPDPQATSPTQGMWNEYYSYLPQSVPSGPATRQARGQSAPQVPQTPQVPNSLRAAIASGMYDPMSDTSQHAGIFDAYQPAVPQSPAPPLPQADPRRAFAPIEFPWNDDMQQAEAGRETLFAMGRDPLTPDAGSLPRATPAPPVGRATIADLPPLPQSTQVAQAPIPPMRPANLPQLPSSGPPMATFAGQQVASGPSGLPSSAAPGTIMRGEDGKNYQWAETTGMVGATGNQGWLETSMSPTKNPVEQAGQFLGDFQNNGGIWGMGLNALAGRGLFPGDDGVIPQFKADVSSRMEQGADPISAVFSRTNRRPPMFTSSAPGGYATPVRSVSRSGGGSGYLSVPGRSGPSRFDQEYHSGQNMDVARANQRALRNAAGNSTREKIDNYLASGGTLYKAG